MACQLYLLFEAVLSCVCVHTKYFRGVDGVLRV
jgi:hypothetical protein